MNGRGGTALVAAAVAVAVGFALFTWYAGRTAAPVGRGSEAPPFALPALDGRRVSLADLRGRVVLVNFWATWCKPCEDEMPAMETLYRRLHPEGLELVAISVDGTRDVVDAFRERLRLSFPILLDPERDVADAYQTFRFPESLLLDADGVVVERYVGPKEWDAEPYVERIRRLLPSQRS